MKFVLKLMAPNGSSTRAIAKRIARLPGVTRDETRSANMRPKGAMSSMRGKRIKGLGHCARKITWTMKPLITRWKTTPS
jgi:hypothetical protein